MSNFARFVRVARRTFPAACLTLLFVGCDKVDELVGNAPQPQRTVPPPPQPVAPPPQPQPAPPPVVRPTPPTPPAKPTLPEDPVNNLAFNAEQRSASYANLVQMRNGWAKVYYQKAREVKLTEQPNPAGGLPLMAVDFTISGRVAGKPGMTREQAQTAPFAVDDVNATFMIRAIVAWENEKWVLRGGEWKQTAPPLAGSFPLEKNPALRELCAHLFCQ